MFDDKTASLARYRTFVFGGFVGIPRDMMTRLSSSGYRYRDVYNRFSCRPLCDVFVVVVSSISISVSVLVIFSLCSAQRSAVLSRRSACRCIIHSLFFFFYLYSQPHHTRDQTAERNHKNRHQMVHEGRKGSSVTRRDRHKAAGTRFYCGAARSTG